MNPTRASDSEPSARARVAAGSVVMVASWVGVRLPGITDLLRALAIDLTLGGMAGLHFRMLTARGEFSAQGGENSHSPPVFL